MAITEEEWIDVTEKFHALDVPEMFDYADDREQLESLYKLHEMAKKVLDPELNEFNRNTGAMLLELTDEAEEIQSNLRGTRESIDALDKLLSKLIAAMPNSIYETEEV